MDHLGEIIALGVDAVFFSICSKFYFKYTYSINLVERAQRLGINPNWSSLSEDSKHYVIIQGNVKAIEKPIKSLNAPDVTGVIQKLTIREHAIARTASGFWSDRKNIIQEAFNTVPFVLRRGKYEVEIVDPLRADVLDLDTVYDKFEAKSLSLVDNVMGFLYGVKQRGIETTEELLKEGSIITAIGEMTEVEGRAQLVPSTKGYSYFLVSMPISSLLRKLEETRITFRWLTLLFGAVGIVLGTILFRRLWKERQMKQQDEEIRRRLEESRKERRKNVRRNSELSDAERCVVCQVNPKEIIVLPCGHVSLCEDCSELVNNDCPICRSPILSKAAAFIA